MADLLGEVDTNLPSRRAGTSIRTIKSEARRKTRVLSPPLSENRKLPKLRPSNPTNSGQLLDTPPTEPSYDYDDGFLHGMDDEIAPHDDSMPSSPIVKAIERKAQLPMKEEEEEEEDIMEISQAVGVHNVKSGSVNISGSRPLPKIVKKHPYPSPESSSPTRPPTDEVDPSVWNDLTSKLNVLSSPVSEAIGFGKLKASNATEEDGSLRLFWTDYTEVNGSLCFFGKVQDKKSGSYVSAFVKVDNILRKLFFLPREYRQSKSLCYHVPSRCLHGSGHGRDTSEEVNMQDVFQEVDELMTKLRVGMHKIKPCSRKYAFELPHIPKEADYLKLLYPYNSK